MSKILFKITTEDVQCIAQEKINRKLTSDELSFMKSYRVYPKFKLILNNNRQ